MKKIIEELKDPDLSFPHLTWQVRMISISSQRALHNGVVVFWLGLPWVVARRGGELPPDIQEIIKDFAALTSMEAEDALVLLRRILICKSLNMSSDRALDV